MPIDKSNTAICIKFTWLISLVLIFIQSGISQNIGIGIDAPRRARLEVWGTANAGVTSAAFGGSLGITFQRNPAAVGLNQYNPGNGFQHGRSLGPGFACEWLFGHEKQSNFHGLNLIMFPSGQYDQPIPSAVRAWRIVPDSGMQILKSGEPVMAELQVGRPAGNQSTVKIMGTNHHSYFNYGPDEYTYIRGGKETSDVRLNDFSGGRVLFGASSTRIGINTNYYLPTTNALEIRQSNGGILLKAEFSSGFELRTDNGFEPSLQILSLSPNSGGHTAFSPTNGAIFINSDQRIKQDIQPMCGILQQLLLLRPVNYRMRGSDALAGRQIGFIAQEVNQLFPELVQAFEDGEQKKLSINYSAFGTLALQGVKEEQMQIESLQYEIQEIQHSILELKKRIAKQKK